jgi:hypothetical protein
MLVCVLSQQLVQILGFKKTVPGGGPGTDVAIGRDNYFADLGYIHNIVRLGF